MNGDDETRILEVLPEDVTRTRETPAVRSRRRRSLFPAVVAGMAVLGLSAGWVVQTAAAAGGCG